MRRFVAGWLDLWRSRQISIRSPLSPDLALRRLRDGRGYFHIRPGQLGLGQRKVSGRVTADRIRLYAGRMGVHNSWRPVLHGQIVAVSDGSMLTGSLGWYPFIRVFTATWFAGVSGFLVLGLAMTVVAMAAGQWRDMLNMLGFTGAAFGMTAFAIGLMTVAGRWGRTDERFLRAWLDERLMADSSHHDDPDGVRSH